MDVIQQPNKDVLSYLQIGAPIIAQRTFFRSIVTGKMISPIVIYSDGHWAWTSMLIHYYSLGRIVLPSAFLDHISSGKVKRIFLKLGVLQGVDISLLERALVNPKEPVVPLRGRA